MKKGFTLIELLAVIVILAVIALIAVPLISDSISNSKYNSFEETKRNVASSAELYFVNNDDKLPQNTGDQTCPIMIQELNDIFERTPLISMAI